MDPLVDDKDWTWVLDRPCPDCGFDAASMPLGQAHALLDAAASRILQELSAPTARSRPRPTTWSALEYACHVRDTCDIFRARITLIVETGQPHLSELGPRRDCYRVSVRPARAPDSGHRTPTRSGRTPHEARCHPERCLGTPCFAKQRFAVHAGLLAALPRARPGPPRPRRRRLTNKAPKVDTCCLRFGATPW